MVVAIIGSRPQYWSWSSQIQARVERFVAALKTKHPDAIVVSGGARGVDTWAEQAARANDLELISYRPYENSNSFYSIKVVTHGENAEEIVKGKSRRTSPPLLTTYGQAAFRRNTWIVEDADQVVAFWDGQSSGTRNSIEKARSIGRPVHIMR
jgi:predicted Rossmann fold nucleotide-binding protein DprA/Smf involved in DNA uptake